MKKNEASPLSCKFPDNKKIIFVYPDLIKFSEQKKSDQIKFIQKKTSFKNFSCSSIQEESILVTAPPLSVCGVIHSLFQNQSTTDEEAFLMKKVKEITGFKKPFADFSPLGSMKWAFEAYEDKNLEVLLKYNNIKVYSIQSLFISWVLNYSYSKKIKNAVFSIPGDNYFITCEIKNSELFSLYIFPLDQSLKIIERVTKCNSIKFDNYKCFFLNSKQNFKTQIYFKKLNSVPIERIALNTFCSNLNPLEICAGDSIVKAGYIND